MPNLADGETTEINGSGAKPDALRNIEREARTCPTLATKGLNAWTALDKWLLIAFRPLILVPVVELIRK